MQKLLLNPRLFLVVLLLLFFNVVEAVCTAAAPGDSTFNCSISLVFTIDDTFKFPSPILAAPIEDSISPIVSRTWTFTTCSDTILYMTPPGLNPDFSYNPTSPGCYCLSLLSTNQLGQTCNTKICNIVEEHYPPCYISVNDSVNIPCGDSFTFGGVAYSSPVVQTDTFTNVYGCDSVVTLYLNVTTDTVYVTDFLCPGDSLLFYGVWLHYPVNNYDTLIHTPASCDSLVILNTPIIDPLPPTYVYDTICQGDSLLFNGFYLDTAGIYNAHFPVIPQHGCDSIVILTLTVKPAPVVTFTWDSLIAEMDVFPYHYNNGSFVQDTAVWFPCLPYVFVLVGGNPSGGYYGGTDVSNDTMYAFVFYNRIQYQYPNSPDDTITYHYNGNGCAQSISAILNFTICEDIITIPDQYSLNLYPNPAHDYLTVEYNGFTTNSQIEIIDVLGRIVKTEPINGPATNTQVDIATLSNGMYFLRTVNDLGVASEGKFSVVR